MAPFPTLQRQLPNQRQAPNNTSYWPEAHMHHHADCPKWEIMSSFCPLGWVLRAISTPSVSFSLSVSPPLTTPLDDTPNKRSVFFSCRLLFFLNVTFVLAFAFMRVLSLLPPVPSADILGGRYIQWYGVHVGKSSCQTAHNYYFLQSQIFPGQHRTTYPTVTEYWSHPCSGVHCSNRGRLIDIRLQLIISKHEPSVTLGYGECRRP